MSFQDKEFVGAKYNSAYPPPEMVSVLDDGTAAVCSYQTNTVGKPVTTGLKYDLIPASPAHDMWSLGIRCARE